MPSDKRRWVAGLCTRRPEVTVHVSSYWPETPQEKRERKGRAARERGATSRRRSSQWPAAGSRLASCPALWPSVGSTRPSVPYLSAWRFGPWSTNGQTPRPIRRERLLKARHHEVLEQLCRQEDENFWLRDKLEDERRIRRAQERGRKGRQQPTLGGKN